MKLQRKARPLYLQIKGILKDRILHGVYPIDSVVPSEPKLEEEFKVSKITVRNAIQELVQEGYLEKGSGKGTRVIRNASASKLSRRQSFTELLVEEGHRISKRLLRADKAANPEGSEPLRLFGPEAFRIERLYLLDDAPYIHYTHHISTRRASVRPSDVELHSLYALLEEQRVALVDFRDRFEVAAAPEAVAVALGVLASTPLLRRIRYSSDEGGETVEYSEGYYNTALKPYLVHYEV